MADDIQKLKQDIALNRVIIFIGTGVSFFTTNTEQDISHWKGLLKHGFQLCHQSKWIDNQHFHDYYDKLKNHTAQIDDYLSIANQIKDCLKSRRRRNHHKQGDLYKIWLRETIGRLTAKKPELIKAIGELESPILTTNYDSFLEDILNKKSLVWNDYCTNNTNNSIDNLDDCILHLYGHYDETDSIIFSSNDYKRLRRNYSGQVKLRTLIGSRSLLFIGYDSGMSDLHFSNLFKWISETTRGESFTMYKLVKSNQRSDISFLDNIKEIQYGNTSENLLTLLKNLKSFTPLIRESLLFKDRNESIRKKYLNYLIYEFGYVSIFGDSNNNINLPLESVYVELKFDPIHPSIKAMKTLELNEEFKRKLLSSGFFTENEMRQLHRAIMERGVYNPETIYRDFMVDQWLNVLLSNQNIFTYNDACTIKNKINRLKENIMEKNNFKDAKQYQIQQAYNEFKHFIILGHPGSGKTTLSKWLVMNMARQSLGEENNLCVSKDKIPILIPIWKYVDQSKQNQSEQKKSLLEFISENPTFNSTFFNDEERQELASLITASLIQGNVLVIFEGLDEVPAHIDRTDLMKEINQLLERGIDYDSKLGKLTYSVYEQKEINNIKDPNIGNRFIITSRIEGNYFEDINFFIPRLTIENMSNDALKLFCHSYMKSIKQGEKSDQLYNDITQNKDIFQLAINPQIASVIAAIYSQCEDKLPEKRIDLYEKAIEMMIERLISSTSYLGLNSILLWTIMQEIAEYLHSKVEGLSERVLREIIRKCLNENNDDLISKLVNIFKYQAGLLSEFGYNSFRFIHRTFQEYLAGKSIIYSNGIERSEDMIYENIINKIDIPNWRVPLSMTFGILSKISKQNQLFNHIFRRLLTNDQTLSNTLLVPFVIIDSLNDIYFSSKDIEYELIGNLSNMLLSDYKNMLGFARLKEHQELIHSYFMKLKKNYNSILMQWLIEKINHEENMAACANIIYQLKWYHPKFHKIFLKNLHNDSMIWNWPIDSLLRFYSTEVKSEAVLKELKFKSALNSNRNLLKHIVKNSDWLRLIVVLYGGYKNYNSPTKICEYSEISQFLDLNDKQRLPFIFYYQDVWGRDDTTYNMAVHIDKTIDINLWKEAPIFEINEIYKESILTKIILHYLIEKKSTIEFIQELQKMMKDENLCTSERIEVLIALIILEDIDFKNIIQLNQEKSFIKSFTNRIEQLIYVLKDPIARCSTHLSPYLLKKKNQLQNNIQFRDYSKIYLTLLSNSGGLPIDTTKLVDNLDDAQDKNFLHAELFAYKLTGFLDGFRYNAAVIAEWLSTTKEVHSIPQSFLKISDTVQIYKPIRVYPWPVDKYIFQSIDQNDISIEFFNCLQNLNTNVPYVIDAITHSFIDQEYFIKNPDLIPLFVLLHFGIMSQDSDRLRIFDKLIPEINEQINMKEFLYEKIQSISNPYYKSRALYQLADFYDEKADQLLNESFQLTKNISQSVLKFQVLEKIFSISHYKAVFIQDLLDELIITFINIENDYDRVIAAIRLSFYGSGEFRRQYLLNALETLNKMNEDDSKIQLIIKLKPLICLYDDLQIKLNEIIENLQNPINNYFVNNYYGKILSTEKNDYTPDFSELQSLFLLFGQLNDTKFMIDEIETIDQLWINLFKDKNYQLNTGKILEIGLKTEIFLTPQVAIIIDELIQQGKEDIISVLFAYIIKPSNEVLPIVQRWFVEYDHTHPIKQLAALLLVEARYMYESAIDTIIDLLKTDNDQMRYRAQRVFQHPDRDVKEPIKRISVIGEKTMIKIIEKSLQKTSLPRVRAYLNSFSYDLLWDDRIVFQKMFEYVTQLNEDNIDHETQIRFFNKIHFMNNSTWNSIIQTLQITTNSSYIEDIFHSVMILTQYDQITQEDWTTFSTILSTTDLNQFRQQIFFSETDITRNQFILDEICSITELVDDTYFEILQSKLINELTTNIKELSQNTYGGIKHIGRCNFYVSSDTNETMLNTFNNISINIPIIENLIKWLIQKMKIFQNTNNTMFELMLSESLLCLVSCCVQKEDYLYRKITNSPNFDKIQLIQLLEKMLHHHPYFPARGNAFILLSALDHTNPKVILNAMNTLFDENLVKEYSMIGIPLIHLSPNEFLDDLLESIKSESAVKVYEILKIFTDFALNEKLNANSKSKIINYLAHEIGELKSKKPVNYYYTDIKIPFTTTLENELYKSWIKIQGLSGKTQYSITSNEKSTR